MSREVHTQDERQKALKHVIYEAWMLEQTALMLPSSPNLQEPRERAVLESFVIHTRNLLDFLYRGEGKNYIAAEHFIDADVWHAQRPDKTQVLQDAHIRANNDVAHLTYTRLKNSESATPWRIPEITKDILKAYAEFKKLTQTTHPNFSPSEYQANAVSISMMSSPVSIPVVPACTPEELLGGDAHV